ncbi:MAG TPA: hypothetical protein VMJ10_19450 [Kofleriaceae bacterium]|nr:hypothetical protein [Kofleriaceae bacterium]
MWTRTLGVAILVLTACGSPTASTSPVPRLPAPAAPPQTWRPVAQMSPFTQGAAQPFLLTDGTVMIQDLETPDFYRLTPDASGSYANGAWSQLASLPDGYAPLYYASAVLPDGRVIAEGGEYDGGPMVWTTRGAIYDPIANTWSALQPPTGWSSIGDASGMVLAGGVFLLSNCCTTDLALFDPNALTWSAWGKDKADINDEESWVMLPDDTILTVDTNNVDDLRESEILDPHTGIWSFAGDTPVKIDDTDADGTGSHEVGPNVLRADGTVIAFGGNGHNALFDPATKIWSAAPDTPTRDNQQLDLADAPAALLPNGNVLLVASPGVFGTPSYIFEWDGTQFDDVPQTPNCPIDTSYQFAMLMLPTGELLMTDYTNDVEIYTPAPGVADAAIPQVLAVGEQGTTLRSGSEDAVIELYPGATFELDGVQLSGISQAGFYGDDVQTYTSYPLVRVTNAATGDVRYLRTHEHSSRSLVRGAEARTLFDVPPDAEPGPSSLEVVVNGIASPAIAVDVK